MVDTVRTRAELVTLFADNITGNISPQDLRDFLISTPLTGADVKVKYEGEADTNALTDALFTKLLGLMTVVDADTLTDGSNADALHAHFGVDDVTVNCVVTRTASQSISHNTSTNITFPNEVSDTDAFHSVVTNTDRITIPAGLGGLYICTANIEYAGNITGYRFMSINVNNAEPSETGALRLQTLDTTDTWRAGITTLIRLVPGDFITLRTKQKSGVALNVVNASLSAVRIKL